MRICFKMRKFFFYFNISLYICAAKRIIYEQDSIHIGCNSNTYVMR
jgi:hypothetical protein